MFQGFFFLFYLTDQDRDRWQTELPSPGPFCNMSTAVTVGIRQNQELGTQSKSPTWKPDRSPGIVIGNPLLEWSLTPPVVSLDRKLEAGLSIGNET